MAATALLSRHSSNPLEVPSSDSRNRAYLKRLMDIEEDVRQCAADEPTSDAYNAPQMEQYHSHLAQLYPNATPPSYTYVASTSNVAIENLEILEVIGGTERPARTKTEQADEERLLSDEGSGDEDMGNEVDVGEPEDEEDEAGDETDEELTIYLKSREEQAEIEEEILDLESAGIAIIQVDEPALRETLPLREVDTSAYLDWAVEAFRLTTAGVADQTQIHTHMCYAEFTDVLTAIMDLDADVISLEAARSAMSIAASRSATASTTERRGMNPIWVDIFAFEHS